MGLKRYQYDIKAKSTIFNDVNYRSKLESEWAVFFTWIGLEFEYESITFDLDGGIKYTPDFRVKLNGFDCWNIYEIKPENFGEDYRVEKLNNLLIKEYENHWGPTASVLRGGPHEVFRHYSDGNFFSGEKYVCPGCGGFDCTEVRRDGFECDSCDMNTPCGGWAPLEKGLNNKYLIQPHKGHMFFLEDQEYAFSWYKNTVLTALDNALDWRRRI